MLRQLTMLDGVSGDEGEVRRFIIGQAGGYCDEITVDSIGNVTCFKKGKDSSRRFMVTAHMDEVGFIIKSVTEKGFLKFDTVGGIDGRVLIGKKVRLGKEKIPGVIGIKAVHLTTAQQREEAVKIADMYIDIGADSQDDVPLRPGDYGYFDSEYVPFGKNSVKAKALDDRAGCAVLLEMLKERCPYDFYGVFTVQEEVGVRGAKIAAQRIKPHIGFILEGTVCADCYGTKDSQKVTTIGAGPALSLMERTSISHRRFVDFIASLAAEEKIPLQYKRTGMGGNEAGALQESWRGSVTAVLSLPCKYIHSGVSVMNREDFQNMKQLAVSVMKNIDRGWNHD